MTPNQRDPESIWPSTELETEMLVNAMKCQNLSVARDWWKSLDRIRAAGHHIPALLERIRVLEAELAGLRSHAKSLELARRVLAAFNERKGEDINAWAERLARDVENAND